MELTKEDVARLLADPSPVARADVAAKIGEQLSSDELAEKELTLAQDIIRHMAHDLAVQVRMSLAVSVKKAKNLPHDVAMRLARDVEQVSLPVLEFSTILTEEDLLEIVGTQSPEKQEAIARRETVSERVSGAIVEQGGEKAVQTLLGNRGAQISDASIEKAATKFPESTGIQEKLVKREHLPLAVAERLVGKVSDALKEYLIANHQLPTAVVSEMVIQSREQATAALLGTNKNAADIEELVYQLKKNNRLTASLIIRALCVGDIPFFEASMSALGGVPINNARVLIHDAGKLGLKSLYDKTHLPQGMYAIIRVALEVVKEMQLDGGDHDRDRYRARVIERILTQYEDFSQDDLNYLLDKLGDLVDKAA
jgi:uncharacterized protein (DUF2336 family)